MAVTQTYLTATLMNMASVLLFVFFVLPIFNYNSITCPVAAKLVPLAYGIRKLQISCVVEDDKISTDDLEDKIVAFEDYVSIPIPGSRA